MTKSDDALLCLEALCEIYQRMAEAAHAQQWDLLIKLEAEQACLRLSLEEASLSAEAGANNPARREALLRAALAHDAEVRRHVEIWLANCREQLTTDSTLRSLQAAYGSHTT